MSESQRREELIDRRLEIDETLRPNDQSRRPAKALHPEEAIKRTSRDHFKRDGVYNIRLERGHLIAIVAGLLLFYRLGQR